MVGLDAGPTATADAGATPAEDAAVPPTIDGGPGLDAGPESCGAEVCDNGIDDDCDGRIDNGCFCTPGEMAACYGGTAETRGVGACAAGTMACSDSAEFAVWEACEGDVLPGAEACEGAIDEDCDGAVDEGCECVPGEGPTACGSDEGLCQAGNQECIDGMLGACTGSVGPVAETCNGLDDDCDGAVDEELRRNCGSDVGACRLGTETCVDGAWDACSGGVAAADESCDGMDNDCDGSTDEALERECGSAVGACMAGTQGCDAGSWSVCRGGTLPIVEDCNGLDDDCDGSTDEGLTRTCGSDTGACTSGTESCSGGSWSACVGEMVPAAERCDGAVDEDCDGSTDEGCDCTTGDTRACGRTAGACMAGTETCDASGRWGACDGAVGASAETCNGVDDDCDGTVDETLSKSCGSDTGSCRLGTSTCDAGTWGACAGDSGPSAEVCDGSDDDDCDGLVDEGCGCIAGDTRLCGSDVGGCSAGSETCDLAGTWSACSGATGPTAETCNGVDDDCNGTIDEALTQGCGSDVGACASGTSTCSAGAWGSCAGSIGPAAEICEGSVDEDCDGTIDEGCGCTNGESRSCGTDVGTCAPGSQTCVGGMWEACSGEVGPTAETCDGLDNDCDGIVDDGLTRGCGSDIGVCSAGTSTCSAGSWGVCTGEVAPGAEACDGREDEDCDGLVDEGCECVTGNTRRCGTNRGACSEGTETCDATGHWGACEGAVGPTTETCNGIDDDCDRGTDESLTRGCGSDVGACTAGTQSCSRGSWDTCGGSVGPGAEVCDGAVDDDCDGFTDEGCACVEGDTRGCGTDTGACVAGLETCDLSGTWGSCMGSLGPGSEICDGVDNDCDGLIDEDGVCATEPPIVTCGGGITAEVLSTVTLSGTGSDPDGGSVTHSWTVLDRPVGSTSEPSSPMSATTNFFLDAAGDYRLQYCATDDEGDTACCIVSVVSTAPGELHVELSWSTPYGDADLHLLNVTRVPDDGWFTGDDCHYANQSPDWGAPGGDANPNLDRDDTDGNGPENITITQNPQSGTYHVGTHYYCSHSIGGTAGGAEDGPTEATIRIYCGGVLIALYDRITLSQTDDWVTVASVDFPSCVGRSVNAQTNGSSILPATFTSPRHCSIDCSRDRDCPTGEVCSFGRCDLP